MEPLTEQKAENLLNDLYLIHSKLLTLPKSTKERNMARINSYILSAITNISLAIDTIESNSSHNDL